MEIQARGSTPHGDAYRGKKEIRQFFSTLFANSPDLRYQQVEPDWVFGNRAVFQWHRKATTSDGKRQDWLGCDLFTFEGSLIKRKDTYFKIVT
jgi:taurine dehydrogenase small subunit